jgi:hypothetical protein
MRLRVLDFIRGSFPDTSGDYACVEYRLMCSGNLHRAIFGDWSKSTVARNLSPKHFELFVCSSRPEEYPQELSLRFSCPRVAEQYKQSTFSHRPDGEIAQDLCALLTLFCRRLVTVAGKVSESYKDLPAERPEKLTNWPFPLHGAIWRYWSPQPATVTVTAEVVGGELRPRQEVQSHTPIAVAVTPNDLTEFLNKVAENDEIAPALIMAARRYHEALHYIPENVDLSYLLLVSAVESITAKGFKGYKPDINKILESRKELVDYLTSLSLSDEQIRRGIEIIVRENPWTKEKFIKLIETYLSDEVWSEKDPLYPGLEFSSLIPQRNELRKVLTRIYRSRSARSHSGTPYPVYVSIGTSPFITGEAFRALVAASESDKIPPVTWFERVVQRTICNFITPKGSTAEAPHSRTPK